VQKDDTRNIQVKSSTIFFVIKILRKMFQQVTIDEYQNRFHPTWAKTLPPNTPPHDVLYGENDHVFRLTIKEDSLSEEDFVTTAEKKTNIHQSLLWKASGLSVLDTLENARELSKLPILKGCHGICEIKLRPQDGVLKHTPSKQNAGHMTWWHTTSYNAAASIVNLYKI